MSFCQVSSHSTAHVVVASRKRPIPCRQPTRSDYAPLTASSSRALQNAKACDICCCCNTPALRQPESRCHKVHPPTKTPARYFSLAAAMYSQVVKGNLKRLSHSQNMSRHILGHKSPPVAQQGQQLSLQHDQHKVSFTLETGCSTACYNLMCRAHTILVCIHPSSHLVSGLPKSKSNSRVCLQTTVNRHSKGVVIYCLQVLSKELSPNMSHAQVVRRHAEQHQKATLRNPTPTR
jgi:hypothetical protein